jgi:hypothetical protein
MDTQGGDGTGPPVFVGFTEVLSGTQDNFHSFLPLLPGFRSLCDNIVSQLTLVQRRE